MGNTCFLETQNQTRSPAAVPLLLRGRKNSAKITKALLASRRKVFGSMLTRYIVITMNTAGYEQPLFLKVSKTAEKLMLKQFRQK